jgi:FSR family fosmidomycin resistance protein-like MFS transporter
MGGTILLTGLGLSWRVPMLLYGAVALVTAGAMYAVLRALDVGGAAPRPADGDTDADADATPAVTGWGVKSRAGFLALGGIAALDSITRNGFLTFVAFLMIEKGVAAEWAALSVLLALFGGMCGKYACGMLAERIGVVRTIAATEIATSIGILAVVVLPGMAGFVLLPFLGVVLNGTSSAVYGTVGDLIADGRHSRAYGLIYTLGSTCGIVAPLAYGLLADSLGIDRSLTLAALLVLLTLPLCAILSPCLRNARHATP